MLALILVVALLAAADATPARAQAQSSTVSISDGYLQWGFKQSWRRYIGNAAEVNGGSSIAGYEEDGGRRFPAAYRFPIASGSYDPATKTTKLRFSGSVRWTSYCQPRCLLDTTFSDLQLEISPDGQVLRGDHRGYSREDPGGELQVDDDVVLARYDISGAKTTFGTDETEWADMPSTAGPGLRIYSEGTDLDPTLVKYTGPGGAPALDERLETAGAPVLSRDNEWLATPGSAARTIRVTGDVANVFDVTDPDGDRFTYDGRGLALTALDAKTMQPLGESWTHDFPGYQPLQTAVDETTGAVFFVLANQGTGDDDIEIRRALWNTTEKRYDVTTVGVIPDLLTSFPDGVYGMAFNAVKNELAVFTERDTGSYDGGALHRFRPQGAGWSHDTTPVRLPDQDEFAGADAVSHPWWRIATDDARPVSVLGDGYLVASGPGSVYAGDTTTPYPALYVADDGVGVTVTPVPGTTAKDVLGTYYGFTSTTQGPDGTVLLHNSIQSSDSYVPVSIEGGQPVAGTITTAPNDIFPPYGISNYATAMAYDSAKQLTWIADPGDPEAKRLTALSGGTVLGRYEVPGYADYRTGSTSRIAVGPDSAVYVPVTGQGRVGYRRYSNRGLAPAITTQPQSRTETLDVGDTQVSTRFTAAAGAAGDTIQWQVRAPGKTRFADISGETGPTLDVTAVAADDGRQYRAKVTNAIASAASDVATLTVRQAPVLVSDLANVTSRESEDATFLLNVDGNPEPRIVWQRRENGFWKTIEPGDDGVRIDGPALTVLDTALDQSGTQVRAKLINDVATVYSSAVRLTVEPRGGIPAEGLELDDVELAWRGSEELQKAPPFGGSSYFSAGSSDGTRASYTARAGDVSIVQTGAPDSLATWETRAAHVAGAGDQLVRFAGGDASLRADGSGTVRWNGAFTVNSYGGLVPFTLTDPELTVAADGTGTLRADMSGYSSSMADPNNKTPLAPVSDVVVSTFSGVEIDPDGAVQVKPDYAGVQVAVPAGITQQVRTGAGWGSWPQPFVDFQIQTGLSSYWYSSGGGADPYKAGSPFVVDFRGSTTVPDSPASNPGGSAGPAAPAPGANALLAPRKVTPAKPRVLGTSGTKRVRKGAAGVATLACPVGEIACGVAVPARATIVAGGKRYRVTLSAPRKLKPGQRATVRVRLSRAAAKALRGRRATLRFTVTLRRGDQRVRKAAAVRLKVEG